MTKAIILKTSEVTEVAKQLHVQFAHYLESWETLSKEKKRPYIRAASLLITARTQSTMENS